MQIHVVSGLSEWNLEQTNKTKQDKTKQMQNKKNLENSISSFMFPGASPVGPGFREQSLAFRAAKLFLWNLRSPLRSPPPGQSG